MRRILKELGKEGKETKRIYEMLLTYMMSVETIEIEEEIPRENKGTESVGKHM